MAEGLKPCPFCGGAAETREVFVPWTQGFAWIVGCDGIYGSGCLGYAWKLTPLYLTEEQAAKAWNRREKTE